MFEFPYNSAYLKTKSWLCKLFDNVKSFQAAMQLYHETFFHATKDFFINYQ